MSPVLLNSRITVTVTASQQDARGASSATVLSTWQLWANAKAGSGSINTDEQRTQWQYDFKFVVRYYKTQPVTEKMVVTFNGIDYIIRSVVLDKEGQAYYQTLTCDKVQP